MHEPLSNVRPVIFLQFANGTPRTEVWRGLHGASALQADCGKIVIAVSEDIDPANTDAVFWSLAYRSNPVEDVHVEPYRSAGHAPKSGRAGQMRLDHAHRRHAQISDAAAGLAGARIHGTGARVLEGTRLARAHVRPPWHGYSLGDWNETWDLFARNAIAGEWEKNGANTKAAARRPDS